MLPSRARAVPRPDRCDAKVSSRSAATSVLNDCCSRTAAASSRVRRGYVPCGGAGPARALLDPEHLHVRAASRALLATAVSPSSPGIAASRARDAGAGAVAAARGSCRDGGGHGAAPAWGGAQPRSLAGANSSSAASTACRSAPCSRESMFHRATDMSKVALVAPRSVAVRRRRASARRAVRHRASAHARRESEIPRAEYLHAAHAVAVAVEPVDLRELPIPPASTAMIRTPRISRRPSQPWRAVLRRALEETPMRCRSSLTAGRCRSRDQPRAPRWARKQPCRRRRAGAACRARRPARRGDRSTNSRVARPRRRPRAAGSPPTAACSEPPPRAAATQRRCEVEAADVRSPAARRSAAGVGAAENHSRSRGAGALAKEDQEKARRTGESRCRSEARRHRRRRSDPEQRNEGSNVDAGRSSSGERHAQVRRQPRAWRRAGPRPSSSSPRRSCSAGCEMVQRAVTLESLAERRRRSCRRCRKERKGCLSASCASPQPPPTAPGPAGAGQPAEKNRFAFEDCLALAEWRPAASTKQVPMLAPFVQQALRSSGSVLEGWCACSTSKPTSNRPNRVLDREIAMLLAAIRQEAESGLPADRRTGGGTNDRRERSTCWRATRSRYAKDKRLVHLETAWKVTQAAW